MIEEEYLGDGAYVRWNGWQYCLYTSNGISETNHVYLEENELAALDRFRQRCAAIKEERRNETG